MEMHNSVQGAVMPSETLQDELSLRTTLSGSRTSCMNIAHALQFFIGRERVKARKIHFLLLLFASRLFSFNTYLSATPTRSASFVPSLTTLLHPPHLFPRLYHQALFTLHDESLTSTSIIHCCTHSPSSITIRFDEI